MYVPSTLCVGVLQTLPGTIHEQCMRIMATELCVFLATSHSYIQTTTDCPSMYIVLGFLDLHVLQCTLC